MPSERWPGKRLDCNGAAQGYGASQESGAEQGELQGCCSPVQRVKDMYNFRVFSFVIEAVIVGYGEINYWYNNLYLDFRVLIREPRQHVLERSNTGSLQ